MAWELAIQEQSFGASEDISDDQYRFMVLSSDQLRRPDTVYETAIGVLQNAEVEQYDAGTVMVSGVTKVVLGETITAGKWVKPEYVSAADAGKAVICSPSDVNCRGYVLGGGAENELGTILLVGPAIGNMYGIARGATAAVDATAGNVNVAAASMLGGMFLRDPGANRADTFDTAANIIAAMGDPEVGDWFEFTVQNQANGAETITMTTNTGLTLVGTMTIAQNNSKRFRVEVTGAATVTIYSLGTFVH